ncbi:unnamed protein product [Sphagnum balticum]
MQCPNCRQVEDGEWLYANGCCRYYEEEAIHRNFVYAQDADQSYQPGQAAIHVPMYPQQQFNYLHHHCHPQLSLSFENIEWVPGGGNRFSYNIDVLLTVCLWRAWQHEKCNLYTWCMLMVTERACSCVQRTGKPSLQ